MGDKSFEFHHLQVWRTLCFIRADAVSFNCSGMKQMPYRRYSRRAKKPLRAWYLAAGILVAAGLCVLVPLNYDRLTHRSVTYVRTSPAVNWTQWLASIPTGPNLSAQARSRGTRKVYPYSVVPGGVRDTRALRKAVARDPVVAAHYSGFRLASARVVKLPTARSAYVSYRLGNKVYWTRKRLTLAKGEEVITDGEHLARTRCANRISETPDGKVSLEEPAEPDLERPVEVLIPPEEPAPLVGLAPPDLDPVYDPVIPDFSVPTGLPRHETPGVGPSNPGPNPPIVPPFLPPFVGPPPNTPIPPTTPTTPTAPVPEPGTILLFTSGLSAILAFRRKFSK